MQKVYADPELPSKLKLCYMLMAVHLRLHLQDYGKKLCGSYYCTFCMDLYNGNFIPWVWRSEGAESGLCFASHSSKYSVYILVHHVQQCSQTLCTLFLLRNLEFLGKCGLH